MGEGNPDKMGDENLGICKEYVKFMLLLMLQLPKVIGGKEHSERNNLTAEATKDLCLLTRKKIG